MTNGEMKSSLTGPKPDRDDCITKTTDHKKRSLVSSAEDIQYGGGPSKIAEKNLGSRRPSNPLQPPSFNISTRLSPRTFDTSPYQRSDTSFSLVTRSGAYIKTNFKGPSIKKEIFPLQDKDNEKVLRTKTIKLKQMEPSTVASDSSDSGNLNSFANHGDHNYSVEMKEDDAQNAALDHME